MRRRGDGRVRWKRGLESGGGKKIGDCPELWEEGAEGVDEAAGGAGFFEDGVDQFLLFAPAQGGGVTAQDNDFGPGVFGGNLTDDGEAVFHARHAEVHEHQLAPFADHSKTFCREKKRAEFPLPFVVFDQTD